MPFKWARPRKRKSAGESESRDGSKRRWQSRPPSATTFGPDRISVQLLEVEATTGNRVASSQTAMNRSLQSRVFSFAVAGPLVAVLMCECQMLAIAAASPADRCAQHATDDNASTETEMSDCCLMGAAKFPPLQSTLQAPVQGTALEFAAMDSRPLPARILEAEGFIHGPPGNDYVLARTCALLI